MKIKILENRLRKEFSSAIGQKAYSISMFMYRLITCDQPKTQESRYEDQKKGRQGA